MVHKEHTRQQEGITPLHEALLGTWRITAYRYCYGPTEESVTEINEMYELPVWRFFPDGTAVFKDLDCPYQINYRYRIEDDRMHLQLAGSNSEETMELYRFAVKGDHATLIRLTEVFVDDDPDSSPRQVDTIRTELERYATK